MIKKLMWLLSLIALLSFTSCGGGSSKEAKELLQKVLQFVGIPQTIVANICQDANRDGICGGGELFTKVTINKGDNIDAIWEKISLTEDGKYFLETYDPELPILVELEDITKINYDDGKFTLAFDGFVTKEDDNETKEISILESMVDADALSKTVADKFRTLTNTEAQDKYYTALFESLETNINTLRMNELDKQRAMSATIKEMADETKTNQEQADKINACGDNQTCVDNEIKKISDELIIDEDEATEIIQQNNDTSTKKTLFKGENYSIQVNSDSYLYKNGKRYLVWSNGIYSTNSLYGTYDNKVKLSTSVDGINWSTKDIYTTTYGSYNHKIDIDNNGKIHIVFVETVNTGTYGYESRNLVYITNKNGSFEKTILESGSEYSFYSPSKFFFTPDGILNLFYQKAGWYRYNAPLYERNLNDGNWNSAKVVSNLSYGRDDPDDDENMLLSYKIVNGKKVLYVSSGYWHLTYHGEVEYSGHIFKYTQNDNDYIKEELAYSGSFFDFNDGNIVYTNTDRDSLFFNENSIFSLTENETIRNIMYNGETIAINTTKKLDDSTNVYYSYLLSKSGKILNTYQNGYLVLKNDILIFVQNSINPKKLTILDYNRNGI